MLAASLQIACAAGCARAPHTLAPPVSSAFSATLAPAQSTPDNDVEGARAARERLVRKIAASHRVTDPRVLDALGTVPLHRFFEAASIEDAYLDRPRPIGLGQTISQPSVVGMMTQALELTGRERVLEIGTGSGYQAAVLSKLCAHVDSIELLAPLGEAARARLAALGYSNVTVRIGDGYRGWPDDAPFDRILLTAAPPEIPEVLIEELAEGGVLVAPVGGGRDQRRKRIRKSGGRIKLKARARLRVPAQRGVRHPDRYRGHLLVSCGPVHGADRL